MKKALLSLALATMIGTGSAQAATVYAQSVVSTNQGLTSEGTPVSPDRSNPTDALGAPDGKFYSLGIGGSMVLDFGLGLVTSPGVVSEITFRLEGYIEKLKIYVSNTLDFSGDAVAIVSNQQAGQPGGASFSFSSAPFRYVKLVDASPNGYKRDGFDVDSIGFSPVPVPAAGLMLAGALAGLGALRRRSKTA